jgi:elongation factor P--beta-lysine ligase
MKNNRVKELLEKRKIAFTAKDSKMGETVYQCVIFRKIAKISDNFSVILIEFPFGDFPLARLSSVKELELYLDNGGK